MDGREAAALAGEQARLFETLAVIASERARLEAETGVCAKEDTRLAVRADAADADAARAQENLLRAKVRTLRNLARAQAQAYFTRVDFTPALGAPETYYIGRWGVMRTSDYTPVVVDWRSPVANLYYAGQSGRVSYAAPDGAVDGTLTLRRLLSVSGARVDSYADTDAATADQYLKEALGQMSGERLADIVTTIQAEQNAVIRCAIVQGAAGSGKTTIALHRAAWLLYAYQKKLRPEDILILAPNPLFLDYISALLPNLGVDAVRQTTFEGLCAAWLGKRMPRVVSAGPGRGDILRQKGSLLHMERLRAFLSTLENEAFPAGDMRFGSAVLYTGEQVRTIVLRELRPFPLYVRLTELQKYVRSRLKTVAGDMEKWLDQTLDARMDALLRTTPDTKERSARIRKLLDSRDRRVLELREAQKAYLKAFPDTFPALDVLSVYEQFLAAQAPSDPLYASMLADAKERFAKKAAAPEDLPALALIGQRVYGIPRGAYKHVVVDEAQDFSPFHFALLHEIMCMNRLPL